MNLELKNVKYAAFQSHETHCFTASVYVDGKKVGTAENSGQGGPTSVYWDDKEAKAKVEKWVAKLPAVESDFGDGMSMLLKDVEWVIDDLVTDWLLTKDLKRILKNRVVFTKKGVDGVFQTNTIKTPVMKILRDRPIKEWYSKWPNADQFLNLLPFEKALAIYKTC